MKKHRFIILVSLLAALSLALGGCAAAGRPIGTTANLPGREYLSDNSAISDNIYADILPNNPAKFRRDVHAVDFSRLDFTPWDVAGASEFVEKRGEKPYTIMVYMNGSDLESEGGAATDDIIEMLDSGVDSQNANIVLITGGTNEWQNDLIPENECMLWEIKDGYIYGLAGIGLVNMADPGTLASFIDFSADNFPAEKYGLIMWDHGGGSIAGYGHDENFVKNNLTLLDMNYAFSRSVLAEKKLEFLGFDSCLMATLEMAEVASDYANYLVASEDLEPGDGWNYGFLSLLNLNPDMTGAELGTGIVDSFMEFYGDDTDEVLTLSVTDLSETAYVTDALDVLMGRCSAVLAANRLPSFNLLAGKRHSTKTFGEGSAHDNTCDMVDLGDMTRLLSDLYPDEAAELIAELDKCIVYNRHNSDTNLDGLSVYYVYGDKEYGRHSLDIYRELQINDEHTEYLDDFFGALTAGSPRRTSRSLATRGNGVPADAAETNMTMWRSLGDPSGKYIMTGIKYGAEGNDMTDGALWPAIGGKDVCLYEINSTADRIFYAIPAVLNGEDCDIIVAKSRNGSHEWRVLGAREEDGPIIQKGLDPLKKGDKLAFYYQQKDFKNKGDDSMDWHKGAEFTVGGQVDLEWRNLERNDGYAHSAQYIDVRGNEFYSELNPLV
ncbi:MAG: clostripain-related cysteine peptidase [Defluviitaleaceae bacterium]|nr:clostripain-related cysteine peptidase [Defluviitaleaceae bacterium]